MSLNRSNYNWRGTKKRYKNLPIRRHKMTAVKTHSMALKERDVTKIQIETLNPTSST
jgi:hypothetical protein